MSSARRWFLAVLPLLVAVTVFAQQRPTPRKSAPAAARPAQPAGERPRFKAIWEPVNYPEDINLNDVVFLDDQNGWVTGGNFNHGAIILHTTDGGEHWNVQLGDPQNSDRQYQDLRMLDAKTGFAIQHTGMASNLLRITDGEHWLPVGKIAEHIGDYAFVDANTGIALEGRRIMRTTNAGQKWSEVATCAVKAEVEGLARNVTCDLLALHFPSPTVGYAVGFSGQANNAPVVAKTTDGGQTWGILLIPDQKQQGGAVFFLDENTGYMRVGYPDTGQLLKTTDGGEHWTGVATAVGKQMEFAAGRRIGWGFLYKKMFFSVDGGDRWSSRDIAFPVSPSAFSLPQPTHGWVVGEHGMVYRYRIVPIEYSVKGMLDAPAMPGGQ